MEFDALRVLLQSYYDLNLCGLKQSCQSRVMIERDEFTRFIQSDGNDGTIESDGNDEFVESMDFNESIRLNELYRRGRAGGASTANLEAFPQGKMPPERPRFDRE